ncbi:MAG: helix-turn-helix domain-containing protein [Thermoflexibacteraceae bacterium]|jgi:transcriptional regulator with XRE-family HTH domain
MEIHKKIALLRNKRGKTQAEMAVLMDITQQTYARIEKGQNKNMPLHRLEQIAVILETPLYVLINAENELLDQEDVINVVEELLICKQRYQKLLEEKKELEERILKVQYEKMW